LTNLHDFNVQNNRLTGNVPSVPIPNGLTPGHSVLCPNFLNHTPDSDWDAATGQTPWYTNCVGAVPPPTLQGAASRKVHGAAGTFDLALSQAALNPTTEPRQGSTATIVMTFEVPIISADIAVTEGSAAAGAPSFSGNDVIVPLTGVTDQQYETIALTNVASSASGVGGSGSVRIGFLVGDVNQTRVVSVADLGLVNAQLSQIVTAANYLKDVNVGGTITLADKGITNANLTRALPAP
jgi:ethanolamine utilization microcompartment shell protein EutS